MRILLIHNLAPWDPRAGGGQRVQHDLALAAAAAGHEVRALYIGDPVSAPRTAYPIEWVGERRTGPVRLLADTVAVARAVRALVRRWRPDVVHGSAPEAGLVPLVLPPGIGLVATSHHPDPAPLPEDPPTRPSTLATLRRLQAPYLEANLLRRAHRIVAVSRWSADALRSRGYVPDARPIAVVPNGVGADWFSGPARPVGLSADLVLVGRIEPAKGWDVLLDALALPEGPARARLVVAGTGPDADAVARRAGQLGLGERVRLLGRIEPEALRGHLARATALVLPSRRENYPLVLLEAMAAGVPVVATAVGGVPEMIADGENGLLVQPEDPRALAHALARLADDAELRGRLVAGGRAVAERHRWDRLVERLAHQYALAHELARPVPRAPGSPASALFRARTAARAAARAPRASPAGPPAEPRRIAVVRPGRLGDLLLVDPLLAALGERWPEARIELLTDASDRVPPWLLAAPVAHRALALRRGPDAWLRPGAPERRAALAELAQAWKTDRPELLLFAVDLADPVMRALAAELSAAAPTAWRAGLSTGTEAIPELHATVPAGAAEIHEITRLLRVGAAAGASDRFRLPRLPRAASPLAPWRGPTVVAHPGASRENRRWPIGRWGAVAARVAAAGGRFVAVGDAGDRAQSEWMGVPFDDRALLNRMGALDLPDLAAVITGADAFVGNDSFPFHVAAAAGIPALVLVGPGAARWTTYPVAHVAGLREPVICSPRRGEECPVYTTCPHGACMQSIAGDRVVETLLARLTAAR